MLKIRPIQKEDNEDLALVIRKALREFKIDKPGTVYTDPTTDHLFELFQKENSKYWVVEKNGTLLGGCGIYPTQGLPKECAELVKLYLSNDVRGEGLGRKLMEKSFLTARELGYKQLYLESLPELEKAVGMYKKLGFKFIDRPLGNSGHYACNVWMIKDL